MCLHVHENGVVFLLITQPPSILFRTDRVIALFTRRWVPTGIFHTDSTVAYVRENTAVLFINQTVAMLRILWRLT